VRHRYARGCRSAGVEDHITTARNALEPERSHARPQAQAPMGPYREGEEPKPIMHGREKSDSVIVAGKSPNKAGRPATEATERRTEAKENAIQQRTRRAQNRESVSQALERVRQAARQRKKERFTALFHHTTVDLLRLWFFAFRRDAAPGVDGVRWQDYEADLERKLLDLPARVHRGAYRAQPSRR
jgi:RNA-directed DNA polymerase